MDTIQNATKTDSWLKRHRLIIPEIVGWVLFAVVFMIAICRLDKCTNTQVNYNVKVLANIEVLYGQIKEMIPHDTVYFKFNSRYGKDSLRITADIIHERYQADSIIKALQSHIGNIEKLEQDYLNLSVVFNRVLDDYQNAYSTNHQKQLKSDALSSELLTDKENLSSIHSAIASSQVSFAELRNQSVIEGDIIQDVIFEKTKNSNSPCQYADSIYFVKIIFKVENCILDSQRIYWVLRDSIKSHYIEFNNKPLSIPLGSEGFPVYLCSEFIGKGFGYIEGEVKKGQLFPGVYYLTAYSQLQKLIEKKKTRRLYKRR